MLDPTAPQPIQPLIGPRARWRPLLGVWALATMAGLFVAATTKIGRVVFVFGGGHGLHLGDVLAFGSLYLLAGVVTARACWR